MQKQSFPDRMSRLARRATDVAGSTTAITLSVLLMAAWLVWATLARFSADSQLALNSVTSVIQFPLLFLILHAQNKDARANNLKLDELIRAVETADDRYRHLEAAPDKVVAELAEAVEKETCGAS